jgi:hypothetical protein
MGCKIEIDESCFSTLFPPTNIIVEKQKNPTYLIKARSAEYKARWEIVLLVTSVINPGCDIVVDHNCFNQPGR